MNIKHDEHKEKNPFIRCIYISVALFLCCRMCSHYSISRWVWCRFNCWRRHLNQSIENARASRHTYPYTQRQQRKKKRWLKCHWIPILLLFKWDLKHLQFAYYRNGAPLYPIRSTADANAITIYIEYLIREMANDYIIRRRRVLCKLYRLQQSVSHRNHRTFALAGISINKISCVLIRFRYGTLSLQSFVDWVWNGVWQAAANQRDRINWNYFYWLWRVRVCVCVCL